MKRWYLKALLVISVSTVCLGYSGTHILQFVHAQGSPQSSQLSTTQSPVSTSNQPGKALQLDPLALLTALVTTNVTLIIALGSGFTWVFLQYRENLKEYKEQLKNSKETEVQQGLKEQKLDFDAQLAIKDIGIRTLECDIEGLKKRNEQNIQNIDFQIREYCSTLDEILKVIRKEIPDQKDKLLHLHTDLVSQSASLDREIDILKQTKELDLVIDQLSNQKDKKFQIDLEIGGIEEELENLKMILRFIPRLQIHQQIIRDLLVKAVIPPDVQKISNETILRELKEGLEKIKKYEKEEQLESSLSDVRKIFSM